MAELLALLLQMFLGGVLVVAAATKMMNRRRSALAVASWGIVPHRHTLKAATALAAYELLLGTALLVTLVEGRFAPSARMAFASLAAAGVTFAVFALVQAWFIVRRTRATCGCFGGQSAVSVRSSIRAVALGTIALALLGVS